MRRLLHDNGLSIVLLSLFLVFWGGQSVAGHREHNSEQRDHGQAEVSYGTYLRSAHFWEATASLRERGSPESKPVDAPHSQTGSE